MGYPMTYSRVLSRNRLAGNYTQPRQYAPQGWYDCESKVHHEAGDDGPPFSPAGDYGDALRLLSGDLRRLERDATEPGWWRRELANRAGVDEETLVRVLTAFWDGALPPGHSHDDQKGMKFVEGQHVPDGLSSGKESSRG